MTNDSLTPKSVNWPSKALPWKGLTPFDKADSAALHLVDILHSPNIVRRYRQALSRLYRGDIETAVAEISALSKDVGDRDIILANKLASLYVEYGHIHPALDVFQAIDQGDRTQTAWHCNVLASAYLAAGCTEDSRRVYSHMLALNIGDRLETFLALAQTYELEDALQEACHVYELTWSEFPDDGYVGIKLACLWHILAHPEKTEVVLLKLLGEPDTDETSLYKGMAHLALGDPEKAIPFLSHARKVYTVDSLPPFYLALCHILQGKMDLARSSLSEAFEKDVTLWDSDVEMFTAVIFKPDQMDELFEIWPVE